MRDVASLWDSVSFLIVVGGSILVWLIRYMLKWEWNVITKNIGLILGIAYGIIWAIEVVISGNADLVVYVARVPLLYGIILELGFWAFNRICNNTNKEYKKL